MKFGSQLPPFHHQKVIEEVLLKEQVSLTFSDCQSGEVMEIKSNVGSLVFTKKYHFSRSSEIQKLIFRISYLGVCASSAGSLFFKLNHYIYHKIKCDQIWGKLFNRKKLITIYFLLLKSVKKIHIRPFNRREIGVTYLCKVIL